MELKPLTYEQLEQEATQANVVLPIEQTGIWADLEQTKPGRSSWGTYRIDKDGSPVAFLALFDYQTHGYHYLRAAHGPVWIEQPSDQDERELLEALHAYARKHDHKQVFVRLAVNAQLDLCRPALSTIPYNQTVVIDLRGGQEEIISRMKTRGRRDVRKALRESPATYADETHIATSSFDEYYDVMLDTAQRDGFSCAPKESYHNMIRVLGSEHCRLFAGRVENKVVSWYIVVTNGDHAVLYYGASRSGTPKRNFISDGLVLFLCSALSELGIASLDMMGIGNDFAPSLKGLNVFKCKFSKEIVDIAPDRDLPLRNLVYGSLVKARQLLKRDGGDNADANKDERK